MTEKIFSITEQALSILRMMTGKLSYVLFLKKRGKECSLKGECDINGKENFDY